MSKKKKGHIKTLWNLLGACVRPINTNRLRVTGFFREIWKMNYFNIRKWTGMRQMYSKTQIFVENTSVRWKEASSGRVPLLISVTKRLLKGGSAGCWFTLLTRTICWHPGTKRAQTAAPGGRRFTQVRLVLLQSRAERALLTAMLARTKDSFSCYVVICDVKSEKCKKDVKVQNTQVHFFFLELQYQSNFLPSWKRFYLGLKK